MEMRARESVSMSEDLTGAIAPYATSLHDAFLYSHCSSCFSKLPIQSPCVMSCTMCCSVQYCCSECLSSDSLVHSSSGECCFFVDHLKRASPNYVTEGTSDLRAALRLLYVLEVHGLVSSDSVNHYSRIGGLSASGIKEALEEGEEIAERILEGSLLMTSARKSRAQTYVSFSDGLQVERMALWAVITNSVEVQLNEGLAMGIAVYGPSFSWFNHSCFPNASYRFVLAPKNEDCISHKSKSCTVPANKGVEADVWHAWQYEEIDSTNALCKYGPRIVVRCTKPINKGDEVCITYIDLLQTKEVRHSDLWLKYKFICSCNRCVASPEPYVDLILNGETRQYLSEAKLSFPSCPESLAKHDSVKFNEFKSTCEGFSKRMLSLSLHCWPFLLQGLPCLEKINNPIDFSWLGTAIFQSPLSEEDYANLSAHDPTLFTMEQKECILSLAICCVTYCKYLTSICYGPQHYLADHAKDILEGSLINPLSSLDMN